MKILNILQWIPVIGIFPCLFMAENSHKDSAILHHTFSNALIHGLGMVGVAIWIISRIRPIF